MPRRDAVSVRRGGPGRVANNEQRRTLSGATDQREAASWRPTPESTADAVEAAIARADAECGTGRGRARSEAAEIAEQARETARASDCHRSAHSRGARRIRRQRHHRGRRNGSASRRTGRGTRPHARGNRRSRAGRRRPCQRADRGPFVIEAGSVEYAHARLCARYGSRPDELAWRRIEMIRDFGAMLDAARASPLGDWLTRDRTGRECARRRTRDASPYARTDCRDRGVDAVRLARCHRVVRRAGRSAGAATSRTWRRRAGLVARRPARRGAARRRARSPRGGSGLPVGRAPGWIPTASLRCGARSGSGACRSAAHASPLLADFIRLLTEHAATFREPSLVDGWALRRALHARLSQLFRRATLDPAAAFIFLAISALDCERLRGEILRRVAFPRLPLAT